jgi:hypothetical protein
MLFIRFGPFLRDAAGESPHLGRAGATAQGPLSIQLSQFPDRWQRSVMGHEERFPRRRLSDRCEFRKQSVAVDDQAA